MQIARLERLFQGQIDVARHGTDTNYDRTSLCPFQERRPYWRRPIRYTPNKAHLQFEHFIVEDARIAWRKEKPNDLKWLNDM